MDCRAAIRLIPAFLDGELGPEKTEFLSKHLASCGSCRAEMAIVKQTMTAMGECRDIEPAFTLADIKARAAQRQTLRGRAPSFGWFSLTPRWATALGVAVAIFVGAIGGIGLHTVNQPQPPVASRAVSDILSLGASDDPLTDLIAEKSSAPSATSGSNGREGRL